MMPLTVAAYAFTASADVRDNHAAIIAGIEHAAKAKAKLVAFPECSLCGYPPATGAFTGTDCRLAELAEDIIAAAAKRDLVVVFGSTAPDGRGSFLNLAIAGGACPTQRLAKRALTAHDRAWFAPGPPTPLLVRVAGWQIALAICYEVRQARWWYEAAAAGADAAVIIAHQAGSDPDPGTKAQVLPALHAARAAELALPILLANTAAPDRWLESAAWDARGRLLGARAQGLLVAAWEHRSQLDPWYEQLRRDALQSWRG
ncbi:MAG: nitrilase-related carbon-nitrogen hydrolase [Planctomycetota bacterium]|nr:hypothetical protein [Planctomycetota bacterium]MCX8038984.1 hypothetical protein [Planctomycetota bacterium]MDW8372765.1 nitrilase-related carbon-nitrogen hydrolase [Planctomycetota bacterium]